jgi:hypothetical protein
MCLSAVFIHKAPSRSDKPGKIYVFEIPEKQPDLPAGVGERDTELKVGRAVDVPKRRVQWGRKCKGQRQKWVCYWEVPFAAKFGAWSFFFFFHLCSVNRLAEALIHAHFKKAGAGNHPKPCDFCRTQTKHIEKFDAKGCGGVLGVKQVVEMYLRLLKWPIVWCVFFFQRMNLSDLSYSVWMTQK